MQQVLLKKTKGKARQSGAVCVVKKSHPVTLEAGLVWVVATIPYHTRWWLPYHTIQGGGSAALAVCGHQPCVGLKFGHLGSDGQFESH